MKHLTLSLVLLTGISITSCKKDGKSDPSTSKTPKEILMASQWKKSEYRENGVVMPFFASCEMDDILTFANDGNFTVNDGPNKCSPTTTFTDFYFVEADNKTFRWGLLGSGTISFNSTNTSFTFKRTGANTFEYIFVKN